MGFLRACLGTDAPPPTSSSSSSPPPPHPPTTTTARGFRPRYMSPPPATLDDARAALRQLDASIQVMWHQYDANMHAAIIMELLKAQNKLNADLSQYFARLGQPRDERIDPVTHNFAKTEARIADLRKAIYAEVQQFQARVEELRLKMVEIKAGDTTLYRPTYASEIAVFVVELSVYKAKWFDVLEDTGRLTVENVGSLAASLRDEASTLGFPDQIAAVHSKALEKKTTLPVRRRSSRITDSPTSFSEQPHTNGSSVNPNSMSFSADDLFGTASGSFSTSRSIARTNTLRFMAALVRNVDLAGSSISSPTHAVPVDPPVVSAVTAPPVADPPQRKGGLLKHEPLSFSSALYETSNRRQGSIADIGQILGIQPVRGDGRCLFRAVAKGMAYCSNQMHKWNEVAERTAADRLRAAVVRELQARSSLLMEFCVIEGDFDSYCRKMSSPRTWGGEPEILMLASILRRPIAVYIRVAGGQFRQIQVYGRQFADEQICILYSDSIHYDCLIAVVRSATASQEATL